jgi:FkbM family methyltransferase
MKLTLLEHAWVRVLSMLTPDYRSISVDGFRIYGTRQHHLMLYWLMKGKYERHTCRLFEEALEPGMTVLDIGAHIGYFTLLAARAVGPAGRVYAFESDPSNFRYLEHNVALNGMGDIVTAVSKAVTETSGTRSFFPNDKNSLLSSLFTDGAADDRLTVECTTVDDYLDRDARVGVIKIDVEGGELHVLRGMTETLAAQDRVIMFLECNPRALKRAGVSVSALIEELKELELKVQVIDERRRSLDPIDDVIRPELAERKWYANLYCTRTRAAAPRLARSGQCEASVSGAGTDVGRPRRR